MSKPFVASSATAMAVLIILIFAMSADAQSTAGRAQGIRRTADGKPDFTGVWAGPGFSHKVGPNDTDTPMVSRFDPKKMAPFKPGGEALMSRKLTGNLLQDDPTALCLPNGLPRQILSPYAQHWIQAPGQLVILYEYMHFFRVIPTDGRPLPKDVELTWMGESAGRWEGDTLVIESTGLKDWVLDATHDENGSRWHTDALRLTERLRHIDATTVSYEVTLDDPKIWTRPWTQEFQMKLHPTWKLYEFVCEENNRCEAGKCVESDVQKTPGD